MRQFNGLFDGLSEGTVLAVGLYNRQTDDLTAASVLEDITSEPDTTGGYARQRVLFPQGCRGWFVGGDWRLRFNPLTFNVKKNTEVIDGYFVTVVYDPICAQTHPLVPEGITEHPYFVAGKLELSYNLASLDELVLSFGGFTNCDRSEWEKDGKRECGRREYQKPEMGAVTWSGKEGE